MVLPHRPGAARPAAVAAGLACIGLVVLAARHAPISATAVGERAAVYFGAAAAAFAAYLLGLAVIRRRSPGLATVLAVAAAIQLAPLARPLLLSQDALAYWAYGRVAAVHDASPYTTVPGRFPHDPGTRAMSAAWRRTPSVYGPLFALATEGEAAAEGPSPAAAVDFYKVAAAAGMLVVTLLAALLSARPAWAAAAVGWNPLFAVHFAGGGHNDVWMMALLLAALTLERRGMRRAGGFLWACAAAIKWIPLMLLPFHALRGGRRFGWAGLAAGVGAIAIVATLLYGPSWAAAFVPLVGNVGRGSHDSLLHRLGLPHGVALGVGAAGLAAAFAVLGLRARRGRSHLGLAAGALLVCTPWLLPWYVVWALPLAAAEDDGAAVMLALALSGWALLDRATF